MSEVEYRIEYQIQRRNPDEDDFTEIGFGSSGGWGDVDAAIFAVDTDIQRRLWETERGQPDPEEVDR